MGDTQELQNRVIISLLARTVFDVATVWNIVAGAKKKEKAKGYIEAYNALEGKTTTSDIARKLGVNESTIREMLTAWHEQGIVYRVDRGKYIALLQLPFKSPKQVIGVPREDLKAGTKAG